MDKNVAEIMADVLFERARQDAKWGEQNHTPIVWSSIFGEEVGEVFKAINEGHFAQAGWREYYVETIQVIAVGVAMLESLKRNEWSV